MKLITNRIMATIEKYPVSSIQYQVFFHLGGLTHGKVFTFNISYQIADWSCNFMSTQSSALSVDKFITLKPPMPHLSFFFFNMEL